MAEPQSCEDTGAWDRIQAKGDWMENWPVAQ